MLKPKSGHLSIANRLKAMQSMNVIHHYGTPQEATAPDGTKLQRSEMLFVPEWNAFVKCTPYDSHFVYANNTPNMPAYMCTCGAAAVVVPPGPNGFFVCFVHKMTGHHQGESKWV